MALDRKLRVRRKRRKVSLQRKIQEFATLFEMDVAMILRDRESNENEIFKSTSDKNWPYGMEDTQMTVIEPTEKVTAEGKILLEEVEKMARRARLLKFPKPPE